MTTPQHILDGAPEGATHYRIRRGRGASVTYINLSLKMIWVDDHWERSEYIQYHESLKPLK